MADEPRPDTFSRRVEVLARLRCVECLAVSEPEARGWRVYLTDEPEWDDPPGLAFYCPVCAAREFGADSL